MIDKKLTTKIMKSILRRNLGLHDHQIMHPEREWLIGIFIAVICLTITVFFCVRLYWHYSALGPESAGSHESGVILYRADEIDKALEEFSARIDKNEALRRTLLDSQTTINATTTPILLDEPISENTELETPLLPPTPEETTPIDAEPPQQSI